jgi:hypothetical protein
VKKIKTLFVRDPDDRRYVLPEVEPGCEWVTAGEGISTRKYDGTCVMFDGSEWWARREVKPGKASLDGFVAVQHDQTTGKTVGWEPAGQSAFAKYLAEATAGGTFAPDSYELIGPKINGNPEGASEHVVIPHGAQVLHDVPLDYDGLAAWLSAHTFEGIVWHGSLGRMVKIKCRDFPGQTREKDVQ